MANALNTIHRILNAVVPVLVSLGVVYFTWGVVQYVIGGGEEAKKRGRDRIIYGIIGLAVITGVWGLVNMLIKTFGVGGASAPASAGSASACHASFATFAALVGYVTCLLARGVIPFLFALALVVFIWGVIQFFFLNADEEAKRSQGKQFIIWGIIALAVMVSVWGLVRTLGSTFGINTISLPHTATQ